MKIRDFLGSTVLDKNANEVGKVDDVDFNPADGKIEKNGFGEQEWVSNRSSSRMEMVQFVTPILPRYPDNTPRWPLCRFGQWESS